MDGCRLIVEVMELVILGFAALLVLWLVLIVVGARAGVTTSEREFTIGNGESRTGCETGVDCLFKFSGRILG